MPKFDRDILGRLASASNDEITAALAAIREDAAAFNGQQPTQEVRDELRSLKAAAEQLTAQQAANIALADEVAADLAALTEAPTQPDPAPVATDPAPAAPPVETALADKPETDAPPEDKPEDPDDRPEGEAPAVTAAGRRLGSNNTGTATLNRRARRVLKAQVRTTAATNIPGVEVGAQFDGAEALMRSFHERIRTTMSRGKPSANGGDRYEVATLRAEYPEERFLVASGDPMANFNKINAAVDEARSWSAADNANALTAAGLCAPLEVLYDISVIGDTPRPVRDALVRFQVDRGGITYRQPMEGATATGGIGNWTEANDLADPLVPKTCVEIACPGLSEAQIEAIYQCLTFSNMTTRFDPEFMAAVIAAQNVAHARFAENKLLTQLTTGSKAVYSTQLLGAVRDTLVTLDKMIAYFRNYHRLADETTLRFILPLWARYLMRADLTRQMVGDGLETLQASDALITQWFTARNVNVTWHLDGIDPADITLPDPDVVVPAQFYSLLATGSAVPGFPNAISGLLFREGDWMFLDGGTLDLGTVRDSTLNGQNRFQTFSESFEGSAFRGIESFQVVIQTNPIGGSAATINTSGATD